MFPHRTAGEGNGLEMIFLGIYLLTARVSKERKIDTVEQK